MTDFSDQGLSARAERRRREAVASLGTGFPEQTHTIPQTPQQAEQSLDDLWELSCFVYGVPPNIAMDKSVGIKGFRKKLA